MFLSKSIAINTETELAECLRYKLWMFGIRIEGPSKMFCDNGSLYKKVLIPKSTLNENNSITCYHKYREAVAVGVSRIPKEGTDTNLDDMFTNMFFQIRRETLLDKFTY